MDSEEYITIKLKDWEEVCDDSHLLKCLQAAGVDNWDGYDYAIEMYNDGDA